MLSEGSRNKVEGVAQWSKVTVRLRKAAAATAALLAMQTASGGALTINDINGSYLEGYTWGVAPGTYTTWATFENLVFYTLDGRELSTRGRLTPEASFTDGTVDNLLIDVLDNNGNLAGYLSTGFSSNYTTPTNDPNARMYTWRGGSLWDIIQFDNNGVTSLNFANGTQARFDYRANIGSPVPEPASISLAGAWLWLVGSMAYWRKRKWGKKSDEAPQAA